MYKMIQHFSPCGTKDGQKIPEGQSNSLIENKLTTSWLKIKKTNRQTVVHMTQHRKLKKNQHEPIQNSMFSIFIHMVQNSQSFKRSRNDKCKTIQTRKLTILKFMYKKSTKNKYVTQQQTTITKLQAPDLGQGHTYRMRRCYTC